MQATTGNGGAATTSTTATGLQGGSGGDGGQAGAVTSSGGSAGSGGSAATGGGGEGGVGGRDGGSAGGVGDAATDAPRKHFACPPGPFPKPMPGAPQAACVGFQFNYAYNEGPTWIPSQQAFFFSNFPQGQAMRGDIVKYTPGGSCEVFVHDVGCNGLGLSPNGNVMAACQQPRAIMEFDVVTKAPTVLADMYMGRMLDSPNDLVAHSNGSVYFTNPTYELGGRPPGIGAALFWRDPAGLLTLVRMGGMNGLTLSADERTLYVVGGGAWDIDATGRPSNNRSSFINGDGIATDCGGNLYSSMGTIWNAQGQSQGTFQGGTNLAFGGPDGMTLLVVGGGTTVRTMRMNVPGFP